MTPTIFDAVTKPGTISDGLQFSGETSAEFTDLLFSVEAELTPKAEPSNKEETSETPTDRAFPVFLLPIPLPVDPARPVVIERQEALADRPAISNEGPGPAASVRENAASMPDITLEDMRHGPARQREKSVPVDAKSIQEVLPQTESGPVVPGMEPVAEDHRLRISEIPVSGPPAATSAAKIQFDAADIGPAADPVQPDNGSRVKGVATLDLFEHPSDKAHPIHSSEASAIEPNEIAESKAVGHLRPDDALAKDENSGLTEVILGRFEAMRKVEAPSDRPGSRLPAAVRVTEQVRDQMVTFIPMQLGKGGKEILKMRLHPAELGHLEIELERDASGSIHAQIRTEKESAQHILVEGLNELRDSLRDAGVDVGRLEVSAFSTSSGDEDGRGADPRQTGVREAVENTFAHVDSDHESGVDDERVVSLRA